MVNDADASSSIHETGQPDTPVEVLTDILSKADCEKDVEVLRKLVNQAYKLVSGLDPYLDQISTPSSEVGYQLCPYHIQTPVGHATQSIWLD